MYPPSPEDEEQLPPGPASLIERRKADGDVA
jgi:hypothetical protein